jgi:hypothetical protein
MTSIFVRITTHGRHYRIESTINGKVDAANVFGCTDGMLPLLAWLTAAELQYAGIGARAETNSSDGEATITVEMPSGRLLTFALARAEDQLSLMP